MCILLHRRLKRNFLLVCGMVEKIGVMRKKGTRHKRKSANTPRPKKTRNLPGSSFREQPTLIRGTARSYRGCFEYRVGLGEPYLGLAAAARASVEVENTSRRRAKQCTGVRRLTCRLYRGVDLARFRCSQSRRVQRTAWPESKWLRPSARGHGRSHRGRP